MVRTAIARRLTVRDLQFALGKLAERSSTGRACPAMPATG
jgi:hypothetical protein